MDSQTARCSAAGGPARGHGGGKRVMGRRRHLLVDASGLAVLAQVHAAMSRIMLRRLAAAGSRATPAR